MFAAEARLFFLGHGGLADASPSRASTSLESFHFRQCGMTQLWSRLLSQTHSRLETKSIHVRYAKLPGLGWTFSYIFLKDAHDVLGQRW